MKEFIFVFWITVLPVVALPDVFEGAKVWWFWCFGIILSVYWIRRLIKKDPLRLDPGQWLFLTWIGVLGFTSIVGVHPWESIIGGSYRHQGVIFFLILFLISMTLPVVSTLRVKWMVGLIAVVSLAEAAYIYIQAFVYHTSPWGTFGEVNAAAGYLAVSSIYIMYALKNKFWFSLLAISFLLGSILLTGSRAGLVSISVVLLFLFVRIIRLRGLLGRFVMICGGLILLGAIGLYISWKTDMHPVAKSYEDRSTYWRLAFRGIQDRPMLGYGAESGEVVFETLFLREDVKLVDFMVDRAHNIFLDVALWSGWVGLGVFALYLVASIVDAVRAKRWFALVGIAVWTVYAVVQPVGVVLWVFFILLTRHGDIEGV